MSTRLWMWTLAALVALLGAALYVPVAALALKVPIAALALLVPPDAVEHLAIAHAWIHGAGFVDPVQWFYSIQDPPPVPGFAVRAPIISLLAAASFALGSSLESLFVQHAVFAALVGSAVFAVSAQLMRPGSALLCALAVVISPAWGRLATVPLTEITSVLAVCIVLAVSPSVGRSLPGSVLCAVATVAAWAARPNLGVLFPAVLLGSAWNLGLRARKNWSWWVYALSFPVLLLGISGAVKMATDLAPYAGYGHATVVLSTGDALQYRLPRSEWPDFLWSHRNAIVEQMGLRAVQMALALAGPYFNGLAWLILPGILYGVRRGVKATTLRTNCSLFTLGTIAAVVMTYAAFDPVRYPFLPFVLGTLCGFALLDDLALALERRIPRRWLPVARMIALVSFLGWLAMGPLEKTRDYTMSAEDTLPAGSDFEERLPPIAQACPLLRPPGIVAAERAGSANVWAVHLWCGNPTITLPVRIHAPGVAQRFLAERRVAYVVMRGPASWGEGALSLVAQNGGVRVYRVGDRPAHRWTPPPPLICASRRVSCEERGGYVIPVRAHPP